MSSKIEKSKAIAAAEPPKTPDLFKARAEMNAAKKAFAKIDAQHKRALKRLSEAQTKVDQAVKAMRADAPAGSTWGGFVFGVDAASADDTFTLSRLLSRRIPS